MSAPEDNENELPKSYDELVEAVMPLAAEVKKLQAQMKAAGMFAHDRELVDCPKCGLEEDVTSEGLLITCRHESPGVDTGLRFQPIDDREDWWRCPACGTEFRGEGIAE